MSPHSATQDVSQGQEVTLLLYQPGDQDGWEDRLGTSAHELARAVGSAVTVATVAQGPMAGRASLSVAAPQAGAVHYLALPEGVERAPLEELLLRLCNHGDAQRKQVETPQTLPQPAQLKVYVAPTCPHCPQLVRAVVEIARADPAVTVLVIDAERHTDLAGQDHVSSVPTLIVDNELSLVGVTPTKQIAELLGSRGGQQYDEQVFRLLLEAGRFAEAGQMLQEHKGLDAFIRAWKASTFEERIRLMLTAEHALAGDARALDDLAGSLADVLFAADTVRAGDTADLLGKIAHPSSRRALAQLLDKTTDPELVEAAREALEDMS